MLTWMLRNLIMHMLHQKMEGSSCKFESTIYIPTSSRSLLSHFGIIKSPRCVTPLTTFFVCKAWTNNLNDYSDLVFIQDCTGSQGSYITSATKNIEEISRAIFESGKLLYPEDLRLGLIAFRDHPPQDHTYITKNFGFTSSKLQMPGSFGDASHVLCFNRYCGDA